MINLANILALVRPLAVLDVETTGMNDNDRIIQIAITKHYPDKDPIKWSTNINPEIPIPIESQRIHGITDEMVAAAPTFKSIAEELTKTALTNVDFLGHNVSYDLKMIRSECRRVGVDWDWEKTDARVVDTLRIYQIKDPRDLSAAHFRFLKEVLTGAHDAGRDVTATERILYAQLQEFPDLPRDVFALSDACWPQRDDHVDKSGKIIWKNNKACIGFGRKFNGVELEKVDSGYFDWMLKGDFPPDTKKIIEEAKRGIFPSRG